MTVPGRDGVKEMGHIGRAAEFNRQDTAGYLKVGGEAVSSFAGRLQRKPAKGPGVWGGSVYSESNIGA